MRQERTLAEPPRLIVRNDKIYVRTQLMGDQMICADEDTYDQVGCWQEEHDRRSGWDYVDALLSVQTNYGTT